MVDPMLHLNKCLTGMQFKLNYSQADESMHAEMAAEMSKS